MNLEEAIAVIVAAKSDQLTADDLIAGPRILKITEVVLKPGTEQPVTIHYEREDGKPWKPCKTTFRSLIAIWGQNTPDWAGRSVQVFRDPKVTWAGAEIGGLRICAATHIAKTTEVAERLNGKQIKARKIEPLKIEAAKPREDKAAAVAAAIIARIADAMDVGEVENDPKVIEQRAWLVKNRPELAEQVDAAFNNITEGAE